MEFREFFEVLRFIRDTSPTESELREHLGGESQDARNRYESLTELGMLVYRENRWNLAPEHTSDDGRSFTWEGVTLFLDEDRYTIEPVVTWFPEDWEATIGIAIFLYFVFFAGCMLAPANLTASLWIRGGIALLFGALLALQTYVELVSKEWTRGQKWRLSAQWTIAGLLLMAPLLLLNQMDWR